MPDNIADKIEQELLLDDIDLLRLERGEINIVIKQLKAMELEIIDAIKRLDPSDVSQIAAKRKRLQGLLVVINRRVDKAYNAILKHSSKALVNLVEVEAEGVRLAANRVVGAELMKRRLAADIAEQIVQSTLIPNDPTQGTTLRQRWGVLKRNLKEGIRDRLTGAVQRGQDLPAMLRLIRGNQNVRFRDGLFWKNRSQAETLVRTAQAQIANAARFAAYERNRDAVKGVQATAVLDSRTTLVCNTRHGMAWIMDGGKFPGASHGFPGPPPWHWRCRTTLTPIFHSLEKLQETVDPTIHRQLQELDSEVPFDGKPAQVLGLRARAEKDPARIRKAMGVQKFDLWQEGKISTADLIDQKGRELTLRELKIKRGIE